MLCSRQHNAPCARSAILALVALIAAGIPPATASDPVITAIPGCTGESICDDFDRATLGSAWAIRKGNIAIEGGELVMRASNNFADLLYSGNRNLGDGVYSMRWNPVQTPGGWKQFYVSFRYNEGTHYTQHHRVELRVDRGDLCFNSGAGGPCRPFPWQPRGYDVEIVHAGGVLEVKLDGVVALSTTYPTSQPATSIMLTAADNGSGSRVDWIVYRGSNSLAPFLPLLSTATPRVGTRPGGLAHFTIDARNPTAGAATSTLSLSEAPGWTVEIPPPVTLTLAAGGVATIPIALRAPADAPIGQAAKARLGIALAGRTGALDLSAEVTYQPLAIVPAARVDVAGNTLVVAASAYDVERAALATGADASLAFSISGASGAIASSVLMAYDPAVREFAGAVPLAGFPRGERLAVEVVGVRGDGASSRAATAAFVPRDAPIVHGRVTDALGAPLPGVDIALVPSWGAFLVPLVDRIVIARDTTDSNGEYAIDLAGITVPTPNLRLHASGAGHPPLETTTLRLDGSATAVRRDLTLASEVRTRFGGAIDDLAREIDAALFQATADATDAGQNQDIAERLAIQRNARFQAYDDLESTIDIAVSSLMLFGGLTSTLEPSVMRAMRIASDPAVSVAERRAAEVVLREAMREVAKENVDATALALGEAYDRAVGNASDARFAALVAQVRGMGHATFLAELAEPDGFISRHENGDLPVNVSEMLERSFLVVHPARKDATTPSFEEVRLAPIVVFAEASLDATLARFAAEGALLTDADLDAGRLLGAIDDRTSALAAYRSAEDPYVLVVPLLGWLGDERATNDDLALRTRAEFETWRALRSELDRVAYDQMNLRVGITSASIGATIGFAAGGVLLCGLSAGLGCLVAVAAAEVASSAYASSLKVEVRELDDQLLGQSRIFAYRAATAWGDDHAHAPLLLKSAADTVLRESVEPELFSRGRHDAIAWRDALGAQAARPVPYTDETPLLRVPFFTGSSAWSTAEPVLRIHAANPSYRELPDGSHVPLPLRGIARTTTAYAALDGLFGGRCDEVARAVGGTEIEFALAPDATGARLQTIEIPFEVLAAEKNPCRPITPLVYGPPNENVVTVEIEIGEDVHVVEFTVIPELEACSAGCGPGVFLSGADAPAALLPSHAIAAPNLGPANRSASVAYVAGSDAAAVTFRLTGPRDAQLGLVVRDATGRAAGTLDGLGGEGAEFPAVARRLGPSTLEVAVPDAAGRSFEVEARLLSSNAASVPVTLQAVERARTPAALGGVAREALLGGRDRVANLSVDVREVSLAAPAMNVAATLDMPGIANGALTPLTPMTIPLGDLAAGEVVPLVFRLGTTTAPDGAFTGTMHVRGARADGSLLALDLPVRVVIDRTAPTAAIAIDGAIVPAGVTRYATSASNLTVDAFDATSGLALVEYDFGDGALRPYAGAFRLEADGARALRARVMDRAGNSAIIQRSVVVDDTAPTLILASPSPGAFATTGIVVGGDADGDGFADDAERAAWSNPHDALSTPASTDLAMNGDFSAGIEHWTPLGDGATAAPETSPLWPAWRGSHDDEVEATLRALAAGAVRVPDLVPEPEYAPSSLAISGDGGARQTFDARRSLSGVTLDALAAEPATLRVRATIVGPEGLTHEAVATAALASDGWQRILFPREAFVTALGLPASPLLAVGRLVALDVEVDTTFRGLDAPAGVSVHRYTAPDAWIDNVRVHAPAADRGALHDAAFRYAGLAGVALGAARLLPANSVTPQAEERYAEAVATIASALAAEESLEGEARERSRETLETALEAAAPILAGTTLADAPAALVAALAGGVGVEAPLVEAAGLAVDAMAAALAIEAPAVPSATRAPVVVQEAASFALYALDPVVGGVRSGIASLRMLVDGADRGETTHLDARGLAYGRHEVRFIATDSAGNRANLDVPIFVLPPPSQGTGPIATALARALIDANADAQRLIAEATANPQGFAANALAPYAAALEAFRAAAPAAALGTTASVLAPDPTRIELRDEDADGVPRVWVALARVKVSSGGATIVEEEGFVDTGIGDPDD